MKRTWKRFGSLFLAFCMVFTMLPTMAFAEIGDLGESEFTTPTITEVTVNPTTVPCTGGEVTVTVKGVNLPAISQAGAYLGDTPTPSISSDTIFDGGSTEHTLTLSFGGNLSMTNEKVYTVKIRLDGMPVDNIHTATVTVAKSDLPTVESPIIERDGDLPSSKEVAVGDKLTLTLAATSPDGGTLSYYWYKQPDLDGSDEVLIPGATGATYEIPSVTEADAGYYSVLVRNNKDGYRPYGVYSRYCEVTVKPAEVGNSLTVTGTINNQAEFNSIINDVISTWSGNGNVITLPSNATLNGVLQIPDAVTGFTIYGNGSTITEGIKVGVADATHSPTDLTLVDLTVTRRAFHAVALLGGGALTTSGTVEIKAIGISDGSGNAIEDPCGLFSGGGDLIITAGGPLTITGASKNPGSIGVGVYIAGGSLTLAGGSPVIRGGSGDGISIKANTSGKLIIAGDCSPTITGSSQGGHGVEVAGDLEISTSGMVSIESRYKGMNPIDMGKDSNLDLSDLTGKLVVRSITGDQAISLDGGSVLYPSGLAENKKYNGTDTYYTLDMTSSTTTPVEITGFAPISDIDAGKAGSASYADASEVMAALPTSVTANYSGGTISWPVTTWVDTDTYNPAAAGSYTFTATLGAAPIDYANSGSYTATVEVVVNPAGSTVSTAEQLKAELEKTEAHIIEITDSFTVTEAIFMASDHELRVPSGKTLTFSGEGRIRFGAFTTFPAHTLTINGGGNIVLACSGSYIGISGSSGTLNLSNINVTVSCIGINVKYLNVGDGATITSEGENAYDIIHIFADGICTVSTGGSIDIKDYSGYGINLNGSTLHINGGTVTVNGNEPGNWGIGVKSYGGTYGSLKYTSGTLSGSEGAIIFFEGGTRSEGLNGQLSDQNYILNTSGAVTIGGFSEAPSENGLTAGNYYWDGVRFAKHMISVSPQPQDVSVTEGAISGFLSVSGTASNDETVHYQWWKADQYNKYGGPRYLIAGATGNTFTIPVDLTEGSYYYYCVLSAEECSDVESDTAIVTVNATGGGTATIEITSFEVMPDENVGKAGSTICANAEEVKTLLQAIHPFAAAMHSGDQTILFLITDWEDVDGYNPNKAGSYTFTATFAIQPGFSNSAGHTVSVEVVVAAEDAPIPTITVTRHPENVTVTQGKISGALTAEAVASNGKPVRYQWYRFIGGIGSDNTESIPGATSNTFTIPTNLTPGTYQYLCIFNTDDIDSEGSNIAIVTVNPPSGSGSGDNGGGNGGGSSSGGGSTAPLTTTTTPGQPVTATAPAPGEKFTDIDGHWAKESIDYVVGRGLLTGTSETTFAPNTAMTRGMLVTVLGRLAGIDVKDYTANSFTDVEKNKYYASYIEWAYNKGIVQGIGSIQFAPDRAVTREEIAMIFANYAKAIGYTLPITHETATYADNSSIGSVYKSAVTAMQQAGIMMGDTNNKFNPKSGITRAEVSSMLHRYVELTTGGVK